MSERNTGFRTFDAPQSYIDNLHEKGKMPAWDRRISLYPNLYVELRSITNEKSTALAWINAAGEVEKLRDPSASGLTARNREQVFALHALLRPATTVVVLTGIAGTGKTILTLAAALEQVQNNTYKKVIITRPMSEVGKYKLGALPGDVTEKFSPYLLNYLTNLEQFVGHQNVVQDLLQQSKFEITPLQLIRGASFNHCLVIADEMQVCSHSEVLTLGTRIGEGSKVVIMGDLNQRDENIARHKTGLYKVMNDEKMRESNLVAGIELLKCERSETAKLFALVFEE